MMKKTLKDAVDRWLRGRKDAKWLKYEQSRTSFLLRELGEDTPLEEITRGVIAELRDRMLETRKPATVNRYMTDLRTILNTARDDWEWLEVAPKVKRMQEEERVRWITKPQARRLLEALPEHLADMAQFALATGLRSANIKGLRWEHLDSSLRTISIPGREMKAGKDFSAPLNSTAQAVLRRQRGKHPEHVFVFRGKPVKQCSTRAWREACRKAGVPGLRFHDLRHTFASWHVQAGTHQAKLRELGGWASDRMVQRYAHLGKEHLMDAVDATTF